MSNSKTEYNNYVRANLPTGMTFDSVNARYRYNNHSFVTFWLADWYYNYINKFSNTTAYALGSLTPFFVNSLSDNKYIDEITSDKNLHEIWDNASTGAATCIDSDGSLKWGLHNLVDTRLNESGQWTPTGVAVDTTDPADDVVLNGDFNGGSNWSIFGVGTEIVGNELRIYSADGSITGARQFDILEPGKLYRCTFDVTNIVAGNELRENYSNTDSGILSLGENSFTFIADSTGKFGLKRKVGVTDIYVDNVSVLPVISSGTDSAGEKRYLLTEDTANSTHEVSRVLAGTAGQTYTVNARVKASAGSRTFSIQLPSGVFGTVVRYSYDLDAETATQRAAGTNDSGSIESLGNGEYLCRLTADATTTNQGSLKLYLENVTLTYTGDGTSGMYVSQATVYQSSVGPRAEHIVDGDFPDLSNWDIAGSAWTASGNKAVGVATGGVVERLEQTLSNLTAGNEYRLSFTVDGATNLLGFDIGVDVNFTSEIDDSAILANGTFVYTFTAIYEVHRVSFRFSALSEAGDAANISNVSVLPVTPQMQKSTKDNSLFMENETGAAKYALRVDHSNGVSRTNHIPYSTDFFDSSWSGYWVKPSIYSTTELAPDGTTTATKWNASNTAGGGQSVLGGFLYAPSATLGDTYTASVWVKTSEPTTDLVSFGINDQAYTLISTTTDWVRYTYTDTVSSDGRIFQIRDESNDDVDIYIWGAQSERNNEATDFIPTTGTAVTVFEPILEVLAEPAGTNEIRNSTMQGAAVGVVGSGGALPTNFAAFPGTIAVEVVATGTTNGYQYSDIKITGSPGASGIINFEPATQVVASPGEDWALSFFAYLIEGTATNVTIISPRINWRDGGGSSLSADRGNDFKDETSVSRRAVVATAPASTGYALPQIFLECTGAVDFTIRLYAPQLEQSHVATSFIPTTTAAATRAKDEPTRGLPEGFIQGEGSIYIEGSVDYEAGGSGFPRVFQIDDGSNNNRVSLGFSESSVSMNLYVNNGGVKQTSSLARSIASGQLVKVAARYNDDDFAVAFDGAATITDTSGTTPTNLTAVRLGNVGGVTDTVRIRDFRLFPYSSPAATPGWSDDTLETISGA